MQMYDLIRKTRHREALTGEEISWLVSAFTDGRIPDYMMSAWLMAVCCQGLTEEETAALTIAMRDSGDRLDLSPVGAVTVDKHSTGGIGDKTTLVIAPLVAACGGYVPKMSGRGLGFTGGTIDKLESIPGFSTSLTVPQFLRNTREIGCCVIAQSGDLTPADKKMYALRNLTAAVDSIPLIAASIMSKKLALGADCILLDVKYGSGAFMKTPEDAAVLARLMVHIGKTAGKQCRAVITDMNTPLGDCVGNALEVEEAIAILRGRRSDRLTALCLSLAAQMLTLAGRGTEDACLKMAEDAIHSGAAAEKLRQMIAAQGGDPAVVDDPARLPQAAVQKTVTAAEDGYIASIQSEEVGLACLELGAGRTADHAEIDPAAGVRFHGTVGDHLRQGEPVFTVYGRSGALCETAAARLAAAITWTQSPVTPGILIHTVIK